MIYEKNEKGKKKTMKVAIITWFLSKCTSLDFVGDSIQHKQLYGIQMN